MIGSHNTDYFVNFYNDRVKEIIPTDIIAEPFTYVPILAGQMELAEGNVIVFGDITEGHDIIDTDIEAEVSYEDISAVLPVVSIDISPYRIQSIVDLVSLTGCSESRTITAVLAITIPERIYEESTYMLNVSSTGIPPRSASYVANIGDTIADIKTNWTNSMIAQGIIIAYGSPDNEIWIYPTDQTFCNNPYEAGGPTSMFSWLTRSAYISPFGFTEKQNAIKCGATHGFGIVYKDVAGRLCSVVKGEIGNVYVKFYSETDGPDITQKIKIVFKISHKPPEWANTYEIVYFGNLSMDYFLQMRVDEIVDLAGYGLTNHFAANIQQSLDHVRELNTRWKVGDYIWQKGDRIRFLGSIDLGDGDLDKYTSLYDYEIEETGTAYGEAIGGEWLYFQASTHPTLFAGETNIVAEIYRPRKGIGITTPYGSGMVFGIGVDANGYRYHKGDVDQVINTDGTVNTPAEVINLAHDGYKFHRLNYDHNSSIIHPFWCESFFSSDWWEWTVSSKLTSSGFPFLDDLNQKQTILRQRLRHGGSIITGTRTNNVAHFTYEDYLDLPNKNGIITGIREVGFTLKVFQQYKETSIYINRIQTFNPDGTEQFTLTDKFLGTSRPMEADYGCQHPDSIMVNGRDVYYWDNSQGEFIRSAPNGQIALSGPNYKMSRHFKEIVKWIQSMGGKDLLSVNIGANNEHEEVWIVFQMADETRGLIFSERDSRFKSRINQITESYLHLGNFFAHLYKQRLWIMNVDEGQDYLSWSGTPTYGEIEVIANAQPFKNKVLNACSTVSDHELISESQSVVIPEEASAVSEEMVSNIPVFDKKEGIYYGKIMKDENSKGNFSSLLSKKLNGREMRGRYAFLRFKTEEHDEKVKIHSIVIFMTDSERNI